MDPHLPEDFEPYERLERKDYRGIVEGLVRGACAIMVILVALFAAGELLQYTRTLSANEHRG